MKKILSILAVSVLMGASAHAGFLIDPYFGYIASGSIDVTGATSSGSEIGARLGWDFLGFGVGLDAVVAGTYTYTLTGVATNNTPSSYGLFVSYKFPVFVRVYADYFPSMKETQSTGAYITGTATKLGVQYTGFPIVALGLEMYTGSITNSVSSSGVSSPASAKDSQTRVTLSFPFSL